MRRCVLPLLCFVIALPLFAQTGEPTAVRLESKVLGEVRNVLVRVPASYRGGTRNYPVIYLTDGDRQLAHTAAVADYLAREGRMPEVILVGISNTDRTRDLTPTHVDQAALDGVNFRFPTSGGADRFLTFIATELIPHVEQNYRTTPFRVFMGHSFGGLFAMHSLYARPNLFKAWIAVSPTLTWDDGYVNKRAAEFFDPSRELNATLVLTMGNEGETLAREFEKFEQQLKTRAPKGFEWHAQRFDDEDHGSVVLPSHYAGLRKVFAGFRFPVPMDGDPKQLFAKAKEHFAHLSQRVGYKVPVPEHTLNMIGYRLLTAGDTLGAIEVFEANVDAYPASPNVYDSLGEAEERNGNVARAKELYERAWKFGKKRGDPNTDVFKRNYERTLKATP